MAKAAAYHGVSNVKFFPKDSSASSTGGYGAALPLLYAKNIALNVLLEAQPQYADDRLLFSIPKDDGYDGEFGSTGQDMDLEKALGFVLEGDSGNVRTSLVSYKRGAVYYEFTEHDEDGIASKVKVFLYSVEIGKASETYATDEASVEFGEYTMPLKVYGETLKNSTGDGDYTDENGMNKMAFMYLARPTDAGYATFGDTVPVPKVKAATEG